MADEMPAAFRVEFPGPFAQHDVVVDGWSVPFLEAHVEGEDRITLVLDRRYGLELSAAEAERIVPFIAQAIAVAVGFPSHPDRSAEPPLERLPYPRPRRVTSLVSAESIGGTD